MVTLQFIPYNEIEMLSSQQRISKLLKLVKTDKILLLEGRLRAHEETELIKETMQSISDSFTGIELSVIYPESKDSAFFTKLRHAFINLVLGDRRGMTIIGPANVVEEIKQDPDKIELLTKETTIPQRKTTRKKVAPKKTTKKKTAKKTSKKKTSTRSRTRRR